MQSESELQGSTLGHESFSSADGAALQSGEGQFKEVAGDSHCD